MSPSLDPLASAEMADGERWHRLHPLSPLVRTGRALVPLVVFLLSTGLGSRQRRNFGWNLALEASALAVILILGVVSWFVTRWRIVGPVLQLETGLIRRTSHRYPLAQVQAIDVVESGLARMLGLAELRLRMAGSGRGKSRLAYLPADQTRALRARLLAIAHGVDEADPEPPERLLLTLSTPMLLASMVLSPAGVITILIVAVVGVLAVIAPATAVAFLSAGTASILGLLTSLWRRFNGYYNLQLAEADDGFRLRSGLIQTSAETIPVARVQAIRLVEPLLWRPFGWCRLEVAVAGKKGEPQNEAEGRRLRAVLPVGHRRQAATLLQRLVPYAPTHRRAPPKRARWKAPLSYRNLAWDGDERYILTVGGRLARRTEWVPLSKVQSIRLVQGPMQRALKLASIHIDAAGRSVHAELKDRGIDEIESVLDVLPGLCRAARSRS